MTEPMVASREALVCSEQRERGEEEIFNISIPAWVPVSITVITVGLSLFFFLQFSS
jgi:hypothetical protein